MSEEKAPPLPQIRLTPLAIIGAFLSLTELIAGYTLLNTSGNIQLILTTFVVAFPLLVFIAFFYILAFRNYTLFAPHEYATTDQVSSFVQAMKSKSIPVPVNEPRAAHALLGIFDAIQQELPEIVNTLQPDQKQFTVENQILNGRVWNSSIVTAWPSNAGSLEKITVGSISREQASIEFPFLGPKFTRSKTRKIVQTLADSGNCYYFRIDPTGQIIGASKADNLNSLAQLPVIPTAIRDFVLHAQYTPNIHRDLLIIFGLHEELASSASIALQLTTGIDAVDTHIQDSALTISDEGDVFGTVSDIRSRAK